MSIIGRFFLSFVILILLSGPLSARTGPDIDSFFSTGSFGSPKLSPSGRYVAVPDYRGETDQLAIIDLQNDGKMNFVSLGELDLNWVRWGSEDRVLLGVSIEKGIRSSAYYYRDEDGNRTQTFKILFHRVMAMDRNGDNQAPMFSNAGNRMKKSLSGARVINRLPSDPDHILMSAEDKTLSLWKVNIHDGEADLLEKGTYKTFNWLLNNDGIPVVRYDSIYNDLYTKISVRAPGEEKWEKVVTVKLKDVDSLDFIAATSDPMKYYVRARPDGYDRASIFKYDLETKTILEQVSANDKVDIYAPLVSNDGKYYGSVFFEDRLKYEFTDPELNKHMAALDTFFDREKNVFIQDSSANGEKWLLRVEGPREPGNFYTYDKTKRKVEHLLPGALTINEADLGKMKTVKYAARDGLKLDGYLTLPAKPKSSPAPLIVMPHGGPHVRDYYTFDKIGQFLSTRGYQVFQPNFRGSEGFGEDFKSAGYGEWGGKMQDDITDGVRHLISTGQVDKNKICIVGSSYGGYAALMGAAQTPDLYKCSVSISGVTDLLDMLKHDKDLYGSSSEVYEKIKQTIGNPKKEKEILQLRSPIYQVSNLTVPILLIHGTSDSIVPVRQSQNLYAQLTEAGKSVDYMELADTNHNLSGRDPEDKDSGDYDYAFKQTLAKLETFLAANLKP